MSGTSAWAVSCGKLLRMVNQLSEMGNKPLLKIKHEMSDNNDTSAGREYGSRALARDMLQRDRVLQGARRL